MQCVSEWGLWIGWIGISIGTSCLIEMRMLRTEMFEEGADVPNCERLHTRISTCVCILRSRYKNAMATLFHA